jgi:hypothetical protein
MPDGDASAPNNGRRYRNGSTAQSMASLEAKFSGMSVREVTRFLFIYYSFWHLMVHSRFDRNFQEGRQPNGTAASSRSQSSEAGGRPRHGAKGHHGNRAEKKPAVKPQRVPNADEFPVLAGSTTPPSRSSGSNIMLPNGHAGPTAAQVLSAPPPARARKDVSKESGTKEPSTPPATSPTSEKGGNENVVDL